MPPLVFVEARTFPAQIANQKKTQIKAGSHAEARQKQGPAGVFAKPQVHTEQGSLGTQGAEVCPKPMRGLQTLQN